MAALPAVLLGFEFCRIDRLAVEASDDGAAVRAGRHVAMAGATPGEDRLPVEAHPPPHPPPDEEIPASWPAGCTPNCSRSLISLTRVSGPLSTQTLAPATVSWISRCHL